MTAFDSTARGLHLATRVLRDDAAPPPRRYANLESRLVHDIDEMVDEYGALGVMNAFAEMYPSTWAMRSDPRSRQRLYVNVWPDGTVDVQFELEPSVFGKAIEPRRTESEAV